MQPSRASIRSGVAALALVVACSSDIDPATVNEAAESGAPFTPESDAGGDSSARTPPPDAAPAPDAAPPTPTCTDGIKNQGETDVDCGGSLCPTRCAGGRSCSDDSDCASKLCGAAGTLAQGKCLFAKSCSGGKGAFDSCGTNDDESCCKTLAVPGGTFNRKGDLNAPATVSSFKLDKFEVTVGRLRKFYEAYAGNLRGTTPIPPGAGAHPKIPGSGWRAGWNVRLPGSWQEIQDRHTVSCNMGGNNDDGGAATWTPAPWDPAAGAYDDKPTNCIDWYTAFAFCAWDGGRLATDAEWGFATEGGSEQRRYPWGDLPAMNIEIPPFNDPNTYAQEQNGVSYFLGQFATHAFCTTMEGEACYSVGGPTRTVDPVTGRVTDGPAHLSRPGKKPMGNGRWGHADLGGNVFEWLLDRTFVPSPCVDCASVAGEDPVNPSAYPVVDGVPQWTEDNGRAYRGGGWQAHPLEGRYSYFNRHMWGTYSVIGIRCARD